VTLIWCRPCYPASLSDPKPNLQQKSDVIKHKGGARLHACLYMFLYVVMLSPAHPNTFH